MNYLLGIDSSTVNTGLAVFGQDKKEYTYLSSRLLSAPKADYKKSKMTKTEYAKKKHDHMLMRVNFIITGLLDCLEEYRPGIIVMEDVYAGRDYNTMKMLARIQGGVQGWCLTNGCSLIFKTPSCWRRELGIKTVVDGVRLRRPALKAAAVRYIQERYHGCDSFHVNVTEDEAESLCIALSEIEKMKKLQNKEIAGNNK